MAYNPIIPVTRDLANTLRTGIGNLGDIPLQESKNRLLERKFDLEAPALKLASNKAQRELDWMQQPLDLSIPMKTVFGDNPDPEDISHVLANGYLDDTLKLTGATIKDGKIYKRNGQIATNADIERFSPALQAVVLSKVDPGHRVNQEIRMLENAPQGPETAQELERLKMFKSNPANLIKSYDNQLRRIDAIQTALQARGFRNFEPLDRARQRIAGKIGKQQKAIETAQSQAFEREKMNFERETQIKIQNLKNAASALSASKKGKKATTPSTFEKDSRFLAEINPDISVKEAADIIRADKTMSERIRAAAEEIKVVNTQLENMEIKGVQAAQLIRDVREKYGLEKPTQRGLPKDKENTDPDNIRNLLFK
jgi:hypothetical protein